MNNMSEETRFKLSMASRGLAIVAVLVLVLSKTASASMLTVLLVIMGFIMGATLWVRWVVKSHGLNGENRNNVG